MAKLVTVLLVAMLASSCVAKSLRSRAAKELHKARKELRKSPALASRPKGVQLLQDPMCGDDTCAAICGAGGWVETNLLVAPDQIGTLGVPANCDEFQQTLYANMLCMTAGDTYCYPELQTIFGDDDEVEYPAYDDTVFDAYSNAGFCNFNANDGDEDTVDSATDAATCFAGCADMGYPFAEWFDPTCWCQSTCPCMTDVADNGRETLFPVGWEVPDECMDGVCYEEDDDDDSPLTTADLNAICATDCIVSFSDLWAWMELHEESACPSDGDSDPCDDDGGPDIEFWQICSQNEDERYCFELMDSTEWAALETNADGTVDGDCPVLGDTGGCDTATCVNAAGATCSVACATALQAHQDLAGCCIDMLLSLSYDATTYDAVKCWLTETCGRREPEQCDAPFDGLTLTASTWSQGDCSADIFIEAEGASVPGGADGVVPSFLLAVTMAIGAVAVAL